MISYLINCYNYIILQTLTIALMGCACMNIIQMKESVKTLDEVELITIPSLSMDEESDEEWTDISISDIEENKITVSI